jgi:CheY-like chemotaxis protein
MKRILIVEDDARVAKALEVRIRSAGYATALASDCGSGVAVFSKNQTRPGPAGHKHAGRERFFRRSVGIPAFFSAASATLCVQC